MARRRNFQEDESGFGFGARAMACKLEKGCSPEDPCPRVVEMTGADIMKQLKKVKDSDGFESDAYVLNENAAYLGPYCLLPESLNSERDELTHHCETAIDGYNKKHGTDLKVVDVVKANTEVVYGPEMMADVYYITFKVAKKSGKTSLYQAKVLEPFSYPTDPIKVVICRRKPSSS